MGRKDVFGKAIKDAWMGKNVTIDVRRDDGYLDHERDAKFYLSGFEEFPEVDKLAMDLVQQPVLDVGCGAGRHSLYLQSKGYVVVSVDISPLTIRVASKRGVEAPILAAAPWLPLRVNCFGTIILMFNNFGICGGYKETATLLTELNRVLRPDGRILASSLHPTLTSNENHLKYHESNRRRGLPVGLVTIRLEYGGEVGDWFNLLLASPEEMKMLSEKAGLELVQTIGLDEGPSYVGVIKKAAG
ncbi:MAG: class I SAM-dependent methyltransferase [Promethearchaeati archaeon SRVP18_Atabeyarchaeia-1]